MKVLRRDEPSSSEGLSPEDRALLARRAARLRNARVLSDEGENDVYPVGEFQLGPSTYAIPLAVIRAAVPLRMVTPVPLSSPRVIGVLRFQGRIICAHSLATILGVRGWREDPAVLIVVERRDGTWTAFDCEQIPKPSSLSAATIDDARRRSAGATLEVTTDDLRQVHLIDIEKLLTDRASDLGHVD